MSDEEVSSTAASFIVDVFEDGRVEVHLGSIPVYAALPIMQRCVAVMQSWTDSRPVFLSKGTADPDGSYDYFWYDMIEETDESEGGGEDV